MHGFSIALGCIAALAAAPVAAEQTKVNSQSEFIRLVAGKTISRPFVRIELAQDGSITGRGARWDVTGEWTWRDGFFCRSLYWGGDELGYNCQEVRVEAGRIRFTSDRGTGKSAEFNLK